MNSLFGKGNHLITSNLSNVQGEIGQVTGRIQDNMQGQISGQLGQVKSQVQDKIQGHVGQVQSQVQDNIKGQVGRVQSQVQDKLQGQVGRVQSQVQDKIQGQVGRVQSQVQDNIKGQVGRVQSQVQDKLQGQVGRVQGQVQDKLQGQVGRVQSQVQDKLQGQVGRVQSQVQDKLQGQVGRVQSQVQDNIKGQVGRVQSQVQDKLQGQVGRVQSQVQDKIQGHVGQVQSQVQDKIQGHVGQVQSQVQDKIQGQVGRVQSQVQDKIQGQVGRVQSQVQDKLQGHVGQVQSQVQDKIQGHVGQVQSQVQDKIQGQVGRVQSQVQDKLHGHVGQVQSHVQDKIQGHVGQVRSQVQDKIQGQVGRVQSQVQDKLQGQVGRVQSQVQDKLQGQVGQVQSQVQDKLQGQVGRVQSQIQDKIQGHVGQVQSQVQDKIKGQVGRVQSQVQDKLQGQVGRVQGQVQDKIGSKVGDYKARGLGLLSMKTDAPKSTAVTENAAPIAPVNNGGSKNATAIIGIPTIGALTDGPTQAIGKIGAKVGDFKARGLGLLSMKTDAPQSPDVPDKAAPTANVTNGGSQNLTSMNGLPAIGAFTDGPTQAIGKFGAKVGDFKAKGLGLLSMKTDAPQSTAVTKSEAPTSNVNNGGSQNATVMNGQPIIGAFTNGPTKALGNIKAKAGDLKAKGLGFFSMGQDVENQSPGTPNREGNTMTNRATGVIGMFAGYGNKKGDGNTNKSDSFSTDTDSDGNKPFFVTYEDTKGASCIHTYGAIVRVLLFVTTTLIAARTATVTNNHLIWGAAPFCGIFLALEFALVVFKRLGVEWKWWLPCLLIFLVTALPMIWKLQLDGRVNSNGSPKKADVWTIAASDAAIYLTIISRWFLQGGKVSLLSLAAVLLEFLANASDIMDLLSMTDQEVIRANAGLMYWVLTAWSLSFIKFLTLLDDVIINAVDKNGDANKEGDTNVKTLPLWIQKAFGPKFPELFQILISLLLLDGSFLVLRLYLVIGEGVVTFGLVFFIIKNIVSFVLQVYRLITMYRAMPSTEIETKGSN